MASHHFSVWAPEANDIATYEVELQNPICLRLVKNDCLNPNIVNYISKLFPYNFAILSHEEIFTSSVLMISFEMKSRMLRCVAGFASFVCRNFIHGGSSPGVFPCFIKKVKTNYCCV